MKFVSLFAGIGGFDLALERLGFECVYANDIDKYCKTIFDKHFETKLDTTDIRKVKEQDIPDHDLLVGGFPCQSFSIAGKRGGFEDTRGTLFFEVARILRHKRPRYFILENVRGLLNHDGGKTITTIFAVLAELGYSFEWGILNSKDFNVPQNRERIFIVGHLGGEPRRQVFPLRSNNDEDPRKIGKQISFALGATYYKGINTGSQGGKSSFEKMRRQVIVTGELSGEKWEKFHESSRRVYSDEGIAPTIPTASGGGHTPKILSVTGKYGNGKRDLENKFSDISPALRATQAKRGDNEIRVAIPVMGTDRPTKHQNGRTIKEDGDPSFTITARDRHGIFDGFSIRRLTPLECERLQGFPDNWTEGVSDTQRYKMCGNAVTVNVVEAVARAMFA